MTTRHDFGDKNWEPCHDCGIRLYLQDPCAAVDGALVCFPCGRTRYGNRIAEYAVVWPGPQGAPTLGAAR